jgi:hypothetical protein
MIIVFLAVISFFYYIYQFKFKESFAVDQGADDLGDENLLDNYDEGDDLEGDNLEGDDLEGDDLEGDTQEGDDLEGDNLEGDTQEGDTQEGDEITGMNIKMSKTNSNSLSSVLQDLEKDHDSEIPSIKNIIKTKDDETKSEAKNLSKRINALQSRIADVQRSTSSESSDSKKKKSSITRAGLVIKK